VSARTTAAAGVSADDVFVVLRDAIATVFELDPASIGRDTSFAEDLRADSLGLVAVADIVEEELQARSGTSFRIDDSELERLRTVGDAVDYTLGLL